MSTTDSVPLTSQAEITPDIALRLRVERFYAFEAELLDDRKFEQWVDLFTEEARYWIPTRMTLPLRERHQEIASDHEPAIIDDDLPMLRGRVRRVLSVLQWSEEPPSRTRRLITNVRVDDSQDEGVAVRSNFIVYRTRSERHQDWFIGERFDLLIPERGRNEFRIAERKLILDQTTVLAPSISIFI